MELEFKNDNERELDASSKAALRKAIKPSSQHIKFLSVSHQADLCDWIVDVGGECDGVLVLRSLRIDEEEDRFRPTKGQIKFKFPSHWKAPLSQFKWMSGSGNLVCKDALMERVQGASEVKIGSTELTSAWTVKLLSSNPNLIQLDLKAAGNGEVGEISSMNLPNLIYLYLEPIPKSKATGDSSIFFQNLETPQLEFLDLTGLDPKDLAFMKVESCPEQLSICYHQSNKSAHGGAAASFLIRSIKNWKKARQTASKSHHLQEHAAESLLSAKDD